MSMRSIASSIGSSLRASTSRLAPIIRRARPRTLAKRISPLPLPTFTTSLSVRYTSHASLTSLSPAPGSKKTAKRVGRGHGSKHGGHSSGRGDNGAKGRYRGIPYLGFEGGQTPFYKKVPRRGEPNFMHREYKALNIGRIQDWISQGRFDPTKPLTIREAVSSGMIRGINRVNGIKLCGTVNEEKFGKLPPLTVHLSRFSKAAGEAIVEAGGTCVAVWHNDLALRQELNPWKFRGARAIKSAAPTRRKDIEFYTNPDNFGYLSDPAAKEEMFRSRGWNPEIKRSRFGGLRTDVPQPAGVSSASHGAQVSA